MLKLHTSEAPMVLRQHAADWTRFCREYVAAKRTLCAQVMDILRAHPNNPQPPPQLAISEMHYSETLEKLDSMFFADVEMPLVPKESPTSSCCTSPKPIASSSKSEDRPPSKINTFLRSEYTKICESLKYKFEKIFPPKKEFINTMMDDIKELEYDLNVLEKQCDKLQAFFENPQAQAALLRRRIHALGQVYSETCLHFEKAIDCRSSFNKKLKKYVHDKLAEGEYTREPEHRRFQNPVPWCSGEQNRQPIKTSKENVSTTPQRRSDRTVKSSPMASDNPHESTSKRTPTHEARDHEDQSPVAGCSGEQTRHPAKISKGNISTPTRRSSRTAKASSTTQDDQEATSSKRTPTHSAREDSREKKLKTSETQPLPVDSSPGHMVQVITYENRDDVNFEFSDSAGDTSRDTISTHVYDSVADMGLTGSEDDGKKKTLPKSTKKTGTKSKKASAKKDLAETKDDVAKILSPFKSKHDPKKTGTKPKKIKMKKTPTKSKYAYTSLPQSDSDED